MAKYTIKFVENGVAVFRKAFEGSYGPSPRVRRYIEELADTRNGAQIDKRNLMADRKAITRDVDIAFMKLK